MGKTSIEWTDTTWNPVRGCSRVSEGCRHCYAERIAGRFSGKGQRFEGFAKGKPNDYHGQSGKGRTNWTWRWTGKVELIPSKLDEPLHWRKPRRIFVNSMSDLFHESLPDDAIDSVFDVVARAHRHTFQVLTKRPARMLDYLRPSSCALPRIVSLVSGHEPSLAIVLQTGLRLDDKPARPRWPLPNVWLGVSVEDQATADERIPLLLQTPAAVRWASYEPALGPVDFSRWLNVPTQVAQHCTCGRTLDPEIGQEGIEQSDAIARARHLPGLKGLPATAEPAGAVVQPARPADLLGEPYHYGDVGVVDRDPRAIRSSRPASPMEVALAIKESGHVCEHGGVAGNPDRHRQDAPTATAELHAGRDQAAPNVRSMAAGARAEFRECHPGEVAASQSGVIHTPHCTGGPCLDWVVIGGESGPGARPFDLAWARSTVAQCRAAGVPVFYKQGGRSQRCPHNSKGGHFECFPPDLRIREFPSVAQA